MTPRGAALAVIAFLVVLCGVIPAAQAHDYLVGSRPAPNSSVATAPHEVTLTFNDIVLSRPAKPQVIVKGPNGRYYETDCATVSDRVVTVPVALGSAGRYTITWRVVSADGHPVSDTISFRYTGTATGRTGAATPKSCTASAQPAGKSTSAGVPTAALVAVGVIVVAGVAGAVLIVVTRGRGRHADDTDDLDNDEE